MEKITQQELKHLYDTRRTQTSIVDVRTLSEFIDCRIKKIPYVPLELLDHIEQPQAVWSKSKPVYVISYSEAHSKVFCSRLEKLGYRTFYVEEDGVKEWCRQNLSVIDTLKSCRDMDKSALATTNGTAPNPTLNFEIAVKPSIPLGQYFRSIVGVAWFFEKMNCNIKFVFAEDFNYFENSTLKVSPQSSPQSYIALKLYMREFESYYVWVSSEYAYSVMSRLTIKKEIQEQADEWMRANLKDNWIGVHFRGTDQLLASDYIKPDIYISYLKKVVAKNRSIFVCSDQAQFIDRMSEAFPGRVFSRSIHRSYDNRSLHRHIDYAGLQQRKDSLIDLLILSEAGFVYKTAGTFSSLTRFFNPESKIISLSGKDSVFRRYLPENFVRVPKSHLLTQQNFLKYYYGKLRIRLRSI